MITTTLSRRRSSVSVPIEAPSIGAPTPPRPATRDRHLAHSLTRLVSPAPMWIVDARRSSGRRKKTQGEVSGAPPAPPAAVMVQRGVARTGLSQADSSSNQQDECRLKYACRIKSTSSLSIILLRWTTAAMRLNTRPSNTHNSYKLHLRVPSHVK
ncbi:unnamed protein product [Plutella xylostella]|uniref:(diamondback moth) hypothetical protein n=1 Tax=Plutella xylostella TaxID=51655 RepID=A0A8S4FYM3_PLUXY|nr:unnamed protein product [Plutella xylostella]